MDTSRIPLEVDAPIGPRGLDDLGRVLTELGYEPRTVGRELGQGGEARGGSAAITLKAGRPIPADAAQVLLEAVSNWVRQRPFKPGRFRHKHPRPVAVAITGPDAEVLARAVVQRD